MWDLGYIKKYLNDYYGICMYFLFFYSFNVRFCLKADGKGALPTKLGKYFMEKLCIMVLHTWHLKNVLGYLNNYSDSCYFFLFECLC